MQLFFNRSLNSSSKEIIFNREESRHIVRVLRKKENDVLCITNGAGYFFSAKISLASDKKCIASIVSIEEKQKKRDYYLHIAIAPTKNNDRLEWFLEKATEIGVDEITPIICDNSERKIVKLDRLEKILVAAMKQSLKFHIPKLNAPVKLSEFLLQEFTSSIYIAHCAPSEKKSLKETIGLQSSYIILIGPEGDFSSKEILLSQEKGAVPITLGSSRLRTETAGLVAVQNISFLHQ